MDGFYIFRQASLIVMLVAIGAVAAIIYGFQAFTEPGPLLAERAIVVERGVGLSALARRLEKDRVINSAFIFGTAGRIMGAAPRIQAGEYAIPKIASMADVLTIIQSGNVIQHRLTVPEGLTSAQVVALLQSEPALRGEIVNMPGEGALLPETYFFSLGDERATIIARMKADRDAALAALWTEYGGASPLANAEEVTILASMVEEETANPEERAHIAAVFLNRLARGMRLQSDPTVIYGLTGGEALGRSLTQSDLDAATPYNTYLIRGLPPTAISNPGTAALEAVLRPAASNDLYFVADGNGAHVFAETLEEHNRNVARWRALEADKHSSN